MLWFAQSGPCYDLELTSGSDVCNCIVYYNNAEDENRMQMAGLWGSQLYHSCIQDDPNDPGGVNTTPDVNGNITCKPDFVYDEEPYGFYHIKYESYCRNRGDNTYIGQDEVDRDGEDRIAENTVDIGADEVGCEDTYHEQDWNHDGVINFEEFSVFSAAWRSHDPNDPVCNPNNPGYVSDPNAPGYISASAKANWNPTCNLDTNGAGVYAIDLYDFTAFCENWLWQACWHENYVVVMYGMSGGGENMMMASPASQTMLQAELSLEAAAKTDQFMKKEPDPIVEIEAVREILLLVEEAIKDETHPDADGLMELKAYLDQMLTEINSAKIRD